MAERLLTIQRENGLPDSGPILGSQGLLQALLELGETFLASEIGEDDLQELEAKISAARSRDYNTIHDLQRKIEELSGMSAMVSRLKDELREEKEKAKEEAEDLTQEMAELRYQLMERLEQEQELRAQTEQASLKRISELEEQLKCARRETSALLGYKQSAEVRAQGQALELQHIKSAFEEIKLKHSNLAAEKSEMEKGLMGQLQDFQFKVSNLETDLSNTSLQLILAEEKVKQLQDISNDLKKENEEMSLTLTLAEQKVKKTEDASKTLKQEKEELLLALEQQENDACLQLEIAEEKRAHLDYTPYNSKKEAEGNLPTLQEEKIFLEHEVTEMLQLIADFKLQLQLLAEDCQKAENKLQDKNTVCTLAAEEIDRNDCDSQAMQELLAQDICLSCPDSLDGRDIGTVFGQNEEDRKLQMSPPSLHGEENNVEEKHTIFYEGTEMPDVSSSGDVLTKVEELAMENEHLYHELEACQLLQNNLQLQLSTALAERAVALDKLQLSSVSLSTCSPVPSTRNKCLVDAYEKKQELLHTVQEASENWEGHETPKEQYEDIRGEMPSAAKEQDGLEDRVVELLHRLAGNEEELGYLIQAKDLNIDEVTAVKLTRFDRHLKDSCSVIAELQRERAALAANVVWLQQTLEEKNHELQAEIEQHVEVLIQYEEERGLMEAELEALRHGFYSNHGEIEKTPKNSKIVTAVQQLSEEHANMRASRIPGKSAYIENAEVQSERKHHSEPEKKERAFHNTLEKTFVEVSATDKVFELGREKVEQLDNAFVLNKDDLLRAAEEQKAMYDTVDELRQTILQKDQLLVSQEEEISLQKEINESLTNHASSLSSELLMVRQQLLLCESQANEMGLTIVNLQEALMVERMTATQGQQNRKSQTERLTRWEEDYLHLEMKFDALLKNLDLMQADLGESRKREQEAYAKVKKLELELSVAKEEIVKSEVRLQKILKQKEQQMDIERSKLEAAMNAQKQSNWLLHRQSEHLKGLEAEKTELQRLLEQVRETCEQVEKERDFLKVAYSELENQFSRRRGAFSK